MAPCRAMICHQVTLSSDAEWPKVADAMIEAVCSAIVIATLARLTDILLSLHGMVTR